LSQTCTFVTDAAAACASLDGLCGAYFFVDIDRFLGPAIFESGGTLHVPLCFDAVTGEACQGAISQESFHLREYLIFHERNDTCDLWILVFSCGDVFGIERVEEAGFTEIEMFVFLSSVAALAMKLCCLVLGQSGVLKHQLHLWLDNLLHEVSFGLWCRVSA
tara:strand:+ start:14941 stop:15426 length:486 start_codon:yes stop_codon:yes gene_type:complete